MSRIQEVKRAPYRSQFSVYLPEGVLLDAKLEAGDEVEIRAVRRGVIEVRRT